MVHSVIFNCQKMELELFYVQTVCDAKKVDPVFLRCACPYILGEIVEGYYIIVIICAFSFVHCLYDLPNNPYACSNEYVLISDVVSHEKDFDDNSTVFHPDYTHQVFGEK